MKCSNVCEIIKKYLNVRLLSYDVTTYEDSYDIFVRVHSEGFYLSFQIEIIENPQIVVITSKLPFVKKSIEMSLATSAINSYLINGSFDYDIKEGITTYRISTCWQENTKDDSFISYMLDKAILDIDTYGIEIERLIENKLDLNDFIKNI